jgi:hypothetical protein
MSRFASAVAALALVSTPVLAQHLAEIAATEEQRTLIGAAIGVIGCELREDTIVEWEEDAGIFEVDDTICAFGQYDIKLDADYNIRSLTFDGPLDAEGAPAIVATEAGSCRHRSRPRAARLRDQRRGGCREGDRRPL